MLRTWFPSLTLILALTLTGCGVAADGQGSSRPQAPTPESAANTRAPGFPPPSTNTEIMPSQTSPPEPAGPGDADVLHVRAVKEPGRNAWTFHVTVQHPDRGWEDYADGWDVVTPSGEVLTLDPQDRFTRLLLHPHVDEQPFTRAQSGIIVPHNVKKVRVRAHDLVDGYGGKEVVVDLSQAAGEGYEVER